MQIGIDLVSIKRIRNLMRYQNFIPKIFSQGELHQVNDLNISRKVESLAGKFAVKEAVLKALGKGLGDLDLIDIAIINDKSGKPKLFLYNEALQRANNLGLTNYNVSISHDKDYAIAVVILK